MTPSDIIERYGLAVGLIIFSLTFFTLELWPFVKNKVWEEFRKNSQRRLDIAQQQNNVLIRLESLFSQMVQRFGFVDERTEEILLISQRIDKSLSEHRTDSARAYEQLDAIHSQIIKKVQ